MIGGNTWTETSNQRAARAQRAAGCCEGGPVSAGEDTPECGEEMPRRPDPRHRVVEAAPRGR
ncbi:hypothetical protein GCM10010176_087790 [Nonomuraea spiralis]|nr:hypothetical protein GCM10010176_087790 [Nonomuraea spiralis]